MKNAGRSRQSFLWKSDCRGINRARYSTIFFIPLFPILILFLSLFTFISHLHVLCFHFFLLFLFDFPSSFQFFSFLFFCIYFLSFFSISTFLFSSLRHFYSFPFVLFFRSFLFFLPFCHVFFLFLVFLLPFILFFFSFLFSSLFFYSFLLYFFTSFSLSLPPPPFPPSKVNVMKLTYLSSILPGRAWIRVFWTYF